MNEMTMPYRHRIRNPWRSEVEHATSRSRRLPTLLNLYEWAGKKHFVFWKLECQNGGRTNDVIVFVIVCVTEESKYCNNKTRLKYWLESQVLYLNICIIYLYGLCIFIFQIFQITASQVNPWTTSISHCRNAFTHFSFRQLTMLKN